MNSVDTTEWFIITSARDSLTILFCKVRERMGSHRLCEVLNLEPRSAKFQLVIPDANRSKYRATYILSKASQHPPDYPRPAIILP
jgi:hypothetical protein